MSEGRKSDMKAKKNKERKACDFGQDMGGRKYFGSNEVPNKKHKK